jgi:hypothetical protein
MSKKLTREEIIAKKQVQLQRLHEKILDYSGEAKKKSLELKKEKEDHTSNRLSKSRILMHTEGLKSDRMLR